MSQEKIKTAIPHREPFLLLDEVVEQEENRIVCRKRFTGEEFWYAGHYPDYPITPGVILCEAAMQAGAVLLSGKIKGSGVFSDSRGEKGSVSSSEKTPDPVVVPVATRANNVQFRAMVHPGDEITIDVELVERLADAFFMKARVKNATTGKLACRFEFACTLTERA